MSQKLLIAFAYMFIVMMTCTDHLISIKLYWCLDKAYFTNGTEDIGAFMRWGGGSLQLYNFEYYYCFHASSSRKLTLAISRCNENPVCHNPCMLHVCWQKAISKPLWYPRPTFRFKGHARDSHITGWTWLEGCTGKWAHNNKVSSSQQVIDPVECVKCMV